MVYRLLGGHELLNDYTFFKHIILNAIYIVDEMCSYSTVLLSDFGCILVAVFGQGIVVVYVLRKVKKLIQLIGVKLQTVLELLLINGKINFQLCEKVECDNLNLEKK